ncbi:MFS transporter [Agromyces archimandritae]|uniref:MFS transporter n=1 Tax=Agromyces archimandritae TaxID=2781962 RepID=A0A975FKH1_9MICO|nr:MFS transporter [Agromyces archimandritae]QTX03422.1 MFS transporter [Agromyces archimandritae]
MTDTPTRARRELTSWRNAVFAIFFLSGLSMATWVSRIPAVRDDAGLALDVVGIVILGMSAGSVLGLIAAPWLLARVGAHRGMVLCLILVACGLVVVGVGSTVFGSVAVLIVGMAAFGFGNGAVDVMMNVEGAAAEREIGKTLMPLMHAFFSLGTVTGAAVGAGASAAGIPVLWHASAIAVLIVAGIVVAVRFVPLRAAVGDEVDAGSPRKPWRRRFVDGLRVWGDVRLLLIGVVMLGMAFAEGSANDWIALAAVDGHGLSNTEGAVMFGVFVTAMTVGRVAGGPVIDRFGRVRILQISAVLGIIGLSLFIWGPSLVPGAVWLAVVGIVLWGLGASLGFPVGMSAAADDPKDSAARVSAVAIIGYFAFLAGPPLLGFLGEHFGILNALLVILGLMVLAGLAAPATRERAAR